MQARRGQDGESERGRNQTTGPAITCSQMAERLYIELPRTKPVQWESQQNWP